MFEPGNNSIDPKYARRREVVFLVFAGLFLGSLAMLNVLGISRFIDLSFEIFGIKVPFMFGVGVLAYPLTFLCTDFISELYGKKRANTVVWIGLVLNIWVLFILWLGGTLPPNEHLINFSISYDEFQKSYDLIDSITSVYPEIKAQSLLHGMNLTDSIVLNDAHLQASENLKYIQHVDTIVALFPEYQNMDFSKGLSAIDTLAQHHNEISYTELPPIPSMNSYGQSDWAFYRIKQLTFGAVTASMVAYLTAQFVDVHVFHWLKKITKGRHLWIRNNFSTMTSQLVDSTAVILITHYYAKALPVDYSEAIVPQLVIYILSTYVFKLTVALFDTIPFYIGTRFFSGYLNIPMAYLEKKEKDKY